MRASLLNLFGRPGAMSVLAAVGIVLVPSRSFGTDPFFINYGLITTPPQVDALNFVNYGTIQLSGLGQRFTTANTLNFSNLVSYPGSGVMISSPGWQFDTEPTTLGTPRPAANFFNDNLGVIASLDSVFIGAVSILAPSYLFVTATNIVNHGALITGANGWMELRGQNIDLSRGLVAVIPTSAEGNGSFNGSPSAGLFQPDVAVYDLYAEQTNITFQPSALWDGIIARSGAGGQVPVQLFNPVADSLTNATGPYSVTITNVDDTGTNPVVRNFQLVSNVFKQAVFVGSSGGSVTIRFTPGPATSNTNPLQTVSALISMPLANPVQFEPQQAEVFVQDELASAVGRRFCTNAVYGTLRPTNYVVSRIDQGLGGPGNAGYPEPNFFLDSGIIFVDGNSTNIGSDTVTNTFTPVTGAYAAYGAFFDSLASQNLGIPSGTVTNLPGRVRIFGDVVDLTKSLIVGEGEVIVDSPHLVSSSEAVIDCANLSFNIGNTNGTLKVESLAQPDVVRFQGNLYVWSGMWSNSVQIIITNNFTFTNAPADPNDPTNTNTVVVAVQSPLTNTVAVNYHTMMVDATAMGPTLLPVTVFDFKTRSTNVVVNDPMTVVQSFFIDGESLTLNTNLVLSSYTLANQFGSASTVSIPNWVFTNAPNLLHFTNNGSLSLIATDRGEAHFGDDRAIPYSEFINNGSINAPSIQINSTFIANHGALSAGGPLSVQCVDGDMQNGSSTMGGVGWLTGDTIRFNNYRITANGQMYFKVTGALFDTGPGSGNSFQFQNGFFLLNKPSSGDLLGTTFSSIAPNLVSQHIEVNHVWAADDRGANAAGYVNNEALGQLSLIAQSPDPLFRFAGTSAGGHNALYVDVLDLSGLGTNLLNEIAIDPSLTIYFAAARVSPTFQLPSGPSGQPMEPEEFLDGKFGGHLRWVQCFAGPNSSVAVLINGQTFLVNRALFNSKIIDSDGDSVPNFFDQDADGPFGSTPPCGSAAQSASTFVTIGSPSQGQSVFTSSATLHGSAGATSGNAWVYYKLNGGDWIPATSINGGADWSGGLNLLPGTNLVQAFATGSAGDTSPTNSVSVVYTPGAPIALSIQGVGTVDPFTNGQWLALDSMYTLQAHPGNGYAFSSWSGTYGSTDPQLTFLMKSNLTLTANFAAQPFAPSAASYSGLFRESDEVRWNRSGAFDLTTTASGQYSGAVQIGGKRYSLKTGSIGESGSATNTIARKGDSTLTVVFQIDTSNNAHVTGTVSDGTWTADLIANRASGSGAFAGNYTVVFPGEDNLNEHDKPQGSGYGSVNVSSSGHVQLTGVLADGTKLSQSASLSDDGRWPLFASLNSGKGQILGWLVVSGGAQADIHGEVSWIKQPGAKGKTYPGGFDMTTSAQGSGYTNTVGASILGASSASLALVGADLAVGINNDITIDSNNKVGVPTGSKLKVTLVAPQGLFKGSVPGPNGTIKFGGAILQNQSRGAGYFLDGGESGKATITP